MPGLKLKPDKTLMCPDFDGYKLTSSGDQVTIYEKSIPEGLCTSQKGDNSSYLHTRLDALHNCLTLDISAGEASAVSELSYSSVYSFNQRGQLLAYDYSAVTHLCCSRVVWQADLIGKVAEPPSFMLPPLDQAKQGSSNSDSATTSMFGQLRPSLVFADGEVAVVADGCACFTVLHTGDRSPEKHHTWRTLFTASVGACLVTDARSAPVDGTSGDGGGATLLHIVLVSVCPPSLLPVLPSAPHHRDASSLHLVTWLTLCCDGGGQYSVTRERVFVGGASLEYCHLDASCSALVLLTHQHYVALHDSAGLKLKPERGENKEEDTNQGADKPEYVYKQTDDSVTVLVTCEGDAISSSNVRVCVTSTRLTVGLRDGADLLQGTFQHPVEQDTATWNVDGQRVEVTVCKSKEGEWWSRLLQEADLPGREQLEDDDGHGRQAEDSWGGLCAEMGEKPPYNPGQLESCDDADDDLLLLLLGGEATDAGKDAPKALLGNTQYLATIPRGGGVPPHFCLRHDVDGLVWWVQGSGGGEERFCHTATFNAFGYVRAGKTTAKYTSAPADCSYIAIGDVRSHVYLFCQPLPVGGELKNRRTGAVKSRVARQFLLSLPCHKEIMGLATLPEVLFVCTDSDVYAYALALGKT